MADTPLTVVGAGVVGLAVAARLAPRFPELVVLERRERHGSETSSRNSEVVHAGMYYPTGSLKARLCVRGKHLLYELCERLRRPAPAHGQADRGDERRGDGRARAALSQLGRANGVELRARGPGRVPATGAGGARGGGPRLADDGHRERPRPDGRAAPRGPPARRDCSSRAPSSSRSSGTAGSTGSTIRTPEGLETLTSERVVNAAGLESDRVAALAGIDVDAAGYRLHWCKGSYFAVTGRKARLVSHLVYPVPTHVSLGVHAVLSLDGRLRFGPDAEYLAERRADYCGRRVEASGVRRSGSPPRPRDHRHRPRARHRRDPPEAARPGRGLPRFRDRGGVGARPRGLREPGRDRLARAHLRPRHRGGGRAPARLTRR